MRTHERTYLQTIGANDPDKKDTLHNMMCRFLNEESSFTRIAEILELDISKIKNIKARISHPINKYTHNRSVANLFGFADLVIFFDFDSENLLHHSADILIEVKSNKVDILDCIQQIKSYRTVFIESHNRFNLLVTAYKITSSEKNLLKNNNIFHVELQAEKVRNFFKDETLDNNPTF